MQKKADENFRIAHVDSSRLKCFVRLTLFVSSISVTVSSLPAMRNCFMFYDDIQD
jgi:hypothetical protein